MHHSWMNLKQETASMLSIPLTAFPCDNFFYDLGGIFFFLSSEGAAINSYFHSELHFFLIEA